jgi:hypothetical protein
VLDDLHWADAQSIALLKHLARTAGSAALLVIVTYRDSDLGKDHALTAVLADLHRIDGTQRIALHGLGPDDVAEILTAAAGHELDREGIELAGQIAGETDGNPFFVAEILRSLFESGAIVYHEATSRWSLDRSGVSLPESVREVIERRVERLGEESLEALRLAAVIGRSFDLELLSTIVEADEDQLLDHLEGAVAASLLAESDEQVGRFKFAHALVNQTLYESLGSTRRARSHQRVAEALEELSGSDPGAHLSELALHWRLAAVSVDRDKAVDYALKAGQRALQNLAPAEALKLFSDAVELSGDEDSRERCEALIGLGEAQRQSGEASYRDTLLDATRIASILPDAELAARAALANSRPAAGSGVFGEIDDERIAAIEWALALDDPPDPVRRARLLALQAQELSWDPDFARRKALAEEAIDLAHGSRDERALAFVLHSAFLGTWSAETLGLRVALAEELAGCAAELHDPAVELAAQDVATNVFTESADIGRARAALERKRLIAEELCQPTPRWLAAYGVAGWELLHGRFDAGERLSQQAFQIGQEAGQADAVLVYGMQLMFMRTYQGRAGEIVDMLEQSVSNYPGIAALRAGLATVLSWLDRNDDAISVLEQAASDRFAQVAPRLDKLATLAMYADTAVLTQTKAAALALRDRMEPWADQVVWTVTQGYGHMRLWLGLLAALLGHPERADDHLGFACEFHEANDMPLWAARGHLGWAEALGRRGVVPDAREHATRALELAREHGYGAFEPRAAALLAAPSAAEG